MRPACLVAMTVPLPPRPALVSPACEREPTDSRRRPLTPCTRSCCKQRLKCRERVQSRGLLPPQRTQRVPGRWPSRPAAWPRELVAGHGTAWEPAPHGATMTLCGLCCADLAKLETPFPGLPSQVGDAAHATRRFARPGRQPIPLPLGGPGGAGGGSSRHWWWLPAGSPCGHGAACPLRP